MKKEFNPNIETYTQSPSPEAVKAATMVSRYAYWMANHACLKYFINAFGYDLGNHFWHKRASFAERSQSLYEADLKLWYEMSDNNRARLMHYLLESGYDRQ